MNQVYLAAYGISEYSYLLIAAKSEMEAYDIAREHADYVDFDSVRTLDNVVTHLENCIIDEII